MDQPGGPAGVPLTAHDVRSVRFDRAPFGHRGYAEQPVEQFVELVADTIATLHARLAATQAELDRVRHWREQHDVSPPAPHSDPTGGLRLQARRLVEEAMARSVEIEQLAHRRAEAIVADARAHGQEVLERAVRAQAGQHSHLDELTASLRERLTWMRDALDDEVARLDLLTARDRR